PHHTSHISTLSPYTTLFRSDLCLRVPPKAVNRKTFEALIFAGALDEFKYDRAVLLATLDVAIEHAQLLRPEDDDMDLLKDDPMLDRKSTRLNSSHVKISYAV